MTLTREKLENIGLKLGDIVYLREYCSTLTSGTAVGDKGENRRKKLYKALKAWTDVDSNNLDVTLPVKKAGRPAARDVKFTCGLTVTKGDGFTQIKSPLGDKNTRMLSVHLFREISDINSCRTFLSQSSFLEAVTMLLVRHQISQDLM